jgi:prepilin-type N-terminal cleavage/methylation domain-containing protein
MKKNVRRGFTLPETLVTVTVIAVLAAVVVPAVTQYAGKGDIPSVRENINALATAATNYVADERTYPSALTDVAKYAGGMSFASTSGTSTAYLGGNSSGYALVVENVFDNTHSINGAPYLSLSIKGSASSYSCQDLDTALDDGVLTTGKFQGTASTPCSTGYWLLIPKTT